MADVRVGIGVDAHALEEGVPLVLGGVELEHPRGLAGHSDGDVVAHALIDALLGAAGLGDIGALFPSGDERLAGVSSLALLREAYAQVEAAGWRLVNADCVVVGEEPRIAPHREEMRRRLGEAIGAGEVNVRASNADQLGRQFIVDLNKIVPGIKKGQQSYPIIADGKLFFTSANDQVFAVNAGTGDLLWRYAPNNLAVFQNFGIVANRGVGYCDNRVFLLTLDMTIVALDPNTGKELQRVPIANAVPGAFANYGYSETSAPVCFNNTLIVGAAGSDYGVRGFVMAYNANDLTPAWPTPFWTIPPPGT